MVTLHATPQNLRRTATRVELTRAEATLLLGLLSNFLLRQQSLCQNLVWADQRSDLPPQCRLAVNLTEMAHRVTAALEAVICAVPPAVPPRGTPLPLAAALQQMAAQLNTQNVEPQNPKKL